MSHLFNNTINIFLHYFAKLGKLCPRQKRKWVFGSFYGFDGNPKYLFYDVTKNHPEIRAIWMARSKNEVKYLHSLGYEAYHRYLSIKGIYHGLTAKVYICSRSVADLNKYLSEGSFLVNLWHGVGLKKMKWLTPRNFIKKYSLHSEEEMNTSWLFKIKTYTFLFRLPELLLVPSHFQADTIFIPSFRIAPSKIVYAMYPRNEILIMNETDRDAFINKHEKKSIELINKIQQFKKIYIYMPTWRNETIDFIKEAQINWGCLSESLKKNDSLLILKMHPFTKIDLNDIKQYDNIILYPQGIDVYTILPYTDCLITDYSSVYCDYLLMNKEIILYTFDYDTYVRNDYDLLDYNQYYKGVRANDFNTLNKLIYDNTDCHINFDDYTFVKNSFWDCAFDGTNIVEEIKKRINLK